ncbi:hypothetical protein J6590_005681, partial [Homalodisca vitripennis]
QDDQLLEAVSSDLDIPSGSDLSETGSDNEDDALMIENGLEELAELLTQEIENILIL